MHANEGPVFSQCMCSFMPIPAKHTHTASHLSPSVESNVFILIGVCFVSDRRIENLCPSH